MLLIITIMIIILVICFNVKFQLTDFHLLSGNLGWANLGSSFGVLSAPHLGLLCKLLENHWKFKVPFCEGSLRDHSMCNMIFLTNWHFPEEMIEFSSWLLYDIFLKKWLNFVAGCYIWKLNVFNKYRNENTWNFGFHIQSLTLSYFHRIDSK